MNYGLTGWSTMATAATYQCPNCGGILAYNAQTGRLTCSHCGISYAEGEIERAIPLAAGGASAVAQATEHVKTVDGFLEHAPWEVAGANAAHAVGYACPSCGANVLADQSAVTATCPYCGNNMLVSGIATSENLPDKVLPFSLTREQAEARMKEHFRRKWYLSPQFSAQLEHMQGVYVPYHLYDLHTSGWADYIGSRQVPTGRGGKVETSHIAMHREGYADITNLPVDGSSKMPDAHMDAIAPFDFSKMRDFSTSYVAGYLAEVADESVEACRPRADARAREAFVQELKDDARKATKVDTVSTIASKTNVDLVNVSTCLLPVWLMHCTWAGNQMLFAVNGDTGKCVGDLPVDKKRRTLTLVIGFIIALFLAWPLIVELGTNDDMPGFMILVVICILGLPVLVDAYFRAQMNTAIEAHGDGLEYSTEGLIITNNWNGPKFHVKQEKALADLRQRK